MYSLISSTIYLFCLIPFIRSSLSETDTFSSWSSWIDRHQPNAHARNGIHDDEMEHLTTAELKLLCPAATITDIECIPNAAIDGHFQHVTCDVTSGLRCRGTDNLPNGCYDYKIRYFCDRGYSEDTIVRHRRAPTGMIANCNTWSSWVNDNHPSIAAPTDQETVARNSLDAFCPTMVGGTINKLECEDNKGEPLTADANMTSRGFFVQCSDAYAGVLCTPWDPNVTCADFGFRYYCDCPLSATNPPSTTPGPTTAVVVTSPVTHVTQRTRVATQGGTGANKADNIEPEATNRADTGCKLVDWLIVIIPCSVLLLLNLLITSCLYRKLGTALRQRRGTNAKVGNLEDV